MQSTRRALKRESLGLKKSVPASTKLSKGAHSSFPVIRTNKFR